MIKNLFKKRRSSKEVLEDYMTKTYGNLWLEQCLSTLNDIDSRKKLRDILNLKL